MGNIYARFARLLPREPLQIGEITAHNADGTSTVTLPTGTIRARGQSVPVSQKAFVRGGEVIGPAPTLPSYTVEV